MERSEKCLQRETKLLFRELPFHGTNTYDQFNKSLVNGLPTNKYLNKLSSIYDLDLFNLNMNPNINPDYNASNRQIRSQYYSPYSFGQFKNKLSKHIIDFSMLHNNIVRSQKQNLEYFQVHLLKELDFYFSVIGITETRINDANFFDFNPDIPNYHFEFVPTPLAAGGVGMYIDNTLKYTVVEKISNDAFQAVWIEIICRNKINIMCGVIYRQHNSPQSFLDYFDVTLERISASGKPVYIMGDFNIDLLKSETCNYANNFLLSFQSYSFTPSIVQLEYMPISNMPISALRKL